MTTEPLTDAVKAAAEMREGRLVLSCAEAFKLAEKFSVDIMEIGQCCNQAGIKIVQCQLGCFR